jgi:hypothetical protein
MVFINKTAEELKKFGEENRDAYLHADPFPSIYFDDFFNSTRLNEILEEFPDMSKNPDLKYADANQIKLASKGEARFGAHTKSFMHFMNSQPFLDFLTSLTGIENLIPDPYFDGGGCHQIKPGGMLKIHADFNKHPKTKLDRRINVLVYLNHDWKEEYGGHFELWDKDMKGYKTRILPIFNRMAMFSTTTDSFHGNPNVVACPEDRSRKSLALYYYTNGRPEEEIIEGLEDHNTLFKYRKEDKGSEIKTKLKETAKLFIPPVLLGGFKKTKN